MLQPLLPLHVRPSINMLKYSELFLDLTYFVSILSLLPSHLPTQPKCHAPFPHIHVIYWPHAQCHTHMHTYMHLINHTHTATPTSTHMCCRDVMSVHRVLQFTSEKLAILDCNHFIKSTMNWYPEASKEPFYCILQILSKFTQLAANFTNKTIFLDIYHSFIINYPILSSLPTLTTLFPYLRFKAHLDHLMSFSLVYRGTRCGS